MPTTIAETSHAKRFISELSDVGGQEVGEILSNKRQRVHFNNDVEVLNGSNKLEVSMSVHNTKQDMMEEDEDVEFVLSIGEDGEWDYNITVPSEAVEEQKNAAQGRNEPRAFGDNMLQEEELHNIASSLLCTDEDMNEEPLLRVNSTNSLGSLVVEKTSLKISISECNQDNNTAAMTPLITPPSSPRRIRTLSVDGGTTEEATICEWPCNLTVDNAITAALECSPTLYDERSSCEECGGRNFFAWMREVRLGSK